MNKRTRLAIAAVLVALLASCMWSAAGLRHASRPRTGPLAAVLLTNPKRLVVVDLAAMRVADDVGLRSWAMDVAVDGGTGLAVTTQCGGIGPEADDAIGLYDLRRGGDVRYVALSRPNPGAFVVQDGRAFVTHGLVQTAGLAAEIVDLHRRRVVESGNVPDGSGQLSLAMGTPWWTVVPDTAPSAPAPADPDTVAPPWSDDPSGCVLARFEPGSLRSRLTSISADAVIRVVETDGGLCTVNSHTPHPGDPRRAWISRIDANGTREVVSVGVPGIRHSVTDACVVSDRLWLTDRRDDPGGEAALVAVDSTTLQEVLRIGCDGVPAALGRWRGRLLVAHDDTGRLLVLDGHDGRRIGEVDLGYRDTVGADVDVLDANEGPGRAP